MATNHSQPPMSANKNIELPILEGDMTEVTNPAQTSNGQTSVERIDQRDSEEKASNQRSAELASKDKIVDKVAAVVEDTTRKAIMKASADKGATTFKDKVLSVAKSVGVNTLKGVAAYAIPKIISTVVSGAPALLGLCSRTLDDPVMAPLYGKILKQSSCDDEYLEQVNTDQYAGVRSLVMTTEQGTITSRNTTFNISALISFALGMVDSRPRMAGANTYTLDLFGQNIIRYDPKAVSETRYAFVEWAQRYKDMYSGTDIGPLLRDARQFVDFYDLSVTVGVIKLLLGEPDKLKFSAVEPLLKLFLYINAYYARPIGNELHFLPGCYLKKSVNPQDPGPQYPFSRGGANIPINAWMTTISKWTAYLAANETAPAPLFANTSVYGSTVAVVPITVAMYQNRSALALWTSLFLEYPYKFAGDQYDYCDSNGVLLPDATSDPLETSWCPDAGLVHMPGVREQVLYVLIDANVDAATPVFGIVAQDVVAGVDISAQLNAIHDVNAGGRANMYQAANQCLRWWRTLFGSTDDFRDASIAAADGSVHTFLPTVARDAGTILNPYVLQPTVAAPGNVITPGVSQAPTGYTTLFMPLNITSAPRVNSQRITPFGGTSGTYLGRANQTPLAANKPTELQYPQYSHALGPFIAAKLFIPTNFAAGEVNVNPTQQFYAQVRLGMYMTALFDYYRGRTGFSFSALATNGTAGDFDQFDLYRSAVSHFVSDLFATDLKVCLNGNTLARAQGEYAGLGDNDDTRRRTPSRVLPTFTISMLSRTEICPNDRLEVPADGYRWRSGTVQGFSFNWLNSKEKPFFDNLIEYNTFGPNTNGGALLFNPESIMSWSKVWNAGYYNTMRWYPIDLLRLMRWWNQIPQLEYQGVTYTAQQLATLPVAGFVFMSSAPGQERSVTTDLVISNQNLEAGNSIVLRDKLIHNTGASIRNTPWSNELGVNVDSSLL